MTEEELTGRTLLMGKKKESMDMWDDSVDQWDDSEKDELFTMLNEIALEGESHYQGESEKFEDDMAMLIDLGYATWVERGEDEWVPELTETGNALWNEMKDSTTGDWEDQIDPIIEAEKVEKVIIKEAFDIPETPFSAETGDVVISAALAKKLGLT